MKKSIGFAVIVALLSFVACADASVGLRDDGDFVGTATDINLVGFGEFNGRVATIFSNGHRNGVTDVVSAQVTNLAAKYLAFGVIDLNDIGSLNQSGNTVRSISISDGTPGQMVTVQLSGATGGTLYITDDAYPGSITKTNWDDIAMNAALDSVTLLYVDDTVGWIVVGGNSITVT